MDERAGTYHAVQLRARHGHGHLFPHWQHALSHNHAFLDARAILDKYFKPPYFGDFERALYTGIPYAPMRTIMLMSVMTYPNLGKKRNLTEVHRETPRWYRVGARLFMYQLFFIGLGGLALMFLLGAVTFILDSMGLIPR